MKLDLSMIGGELVNTPPTLTEFPTAPFAGSTISAVQIPLYCTDSNGAPEGKIVVLTLCPHVVRDLARLSSNMSQALDTMLWILNPEDRQKRSMICGERHIPSSYAYSGAIDSMYLAHLTESAEGNGESCSFSAGEAGAEGMHQLLTLERAIRRGTYTNIAYAEGLPYEVHKYDDASCCPARHATYLAACGYDNEISQEN